MTGHDVTLDEDGGAMRLTFHRSLAAPVDVVWEAIVDPVQMSQWYPLRVVSSDLRVGGGIDFVAEDATPYAARITELEPGRRLVFCEEEADVISIEVAEADGGTLLTFTHTFAPGPPPETHAAGWYLCLENLDAVTSGRPVSALVRDLALEDRLAAQIGAGEAPTDRAD